MTSPGAPAVPVFQTGIAPPATPSRSAAAKGIAIAMVAAVLSSVLSQANGLAANDIAGLLSVSTDEGSWIATATSMGEIAVIPIAAVLTAALSLRRMALYAGGLYLVAAAASLIATDLLPFIAARALLGAAGGIMPVMMMVAVIATLPPGPQRAVGLALFAFASSIPSALAPSVGGGLIDTFGVRGLALAEVFWSAGFIVLAGSALPRIPLRRDVLVGADWRSYGPLLVTLASIVLVLSQGERRFWFESPVIGTAAAIAGAAAVVSIVSLVTRPRPLVDLRLLASPTFGWAFVIAIVFRFGLLESGFVMPQILGRMAGFRLPDIGQATIWLGLAHVLCFPAAWWAVARFDPRLSLGLGLLLFTASAGLNSALTLDWRVDEFVPGLLVLGAGQAFFLVATLAYATADVPPALGATAAALFNIARVLGQSTGTAAVATLVTEREKLHSARLVESFTDATPWFAERLVSAVATFQSLHSDAALAHTQGLSIVASAAAQQAFILAYSDAFLVIGAILFAAAFLVLMLPALPTGDPRPNSGRLP